MGHTICGSTYETLNTRDEHSVISKHNHRRGTTDLGEQRIYFLAGDSYL